MQVLNRFIDDMHGNINFIEDSSAINSQITYKTTKLLYDLRREGIEVATILLKILSRKFKLNSEKMKEKMKKELDGEQGVLNAINNNMQIYEPIREIAQMVIEREMRYEFNKVILEFNDDKKVFMVKFNDLYSAMMMAICSIDSKYEYRECTQCKTIFLNGRYGTYCKLCKKCGKKVEK